jgi:hypothetical protein
MRWLLPVIWPAERRITLTPSGMYCIEGETDDGWRLMGLAFRVGDAFALGEALHNGPERLTCLCPRCRNAEVLPDTYAVATDEGWSGTQFRAAALDSTFALKVGPAEVFRNQVWRQALKQAIRGIGRGEKVVLLGESGVGKTLFLRDLAQALAFEGRKVGLLDGGDPGRSCPDADTMLVDNADLLSRASLDALLSLDRPAVFAGRPRLKERIASVLPAASILQLEPLGTDDVGRFVAARLLRAGREPDLADAAAIPALARLSGGLPRHLMSLAGAATFLADIEGSPRLLVQHVEHAAEVGRPGGARLQHTSTKQAGRALSPDAEVTSGETASGRRRLSAVSLGLAVVLLVSWAQLMARHAEVVPRADGMLAETETVPATEQADPGLAPGAAGNLDRGADRGLEGDASVIAPSSATTGTEASNLADGPRLASVLPTFLGSFQGLVSNEALRLTGKLSLEVTRDGPPGVVRARFHAWDGLLGTGELTGTLSPDGRLTLSGQLSMGRNPFNCRLAAVIRGDHITGSAQFVRPRGGRVAYSSFNLLKT